MLFSKYGFNPLYNVILCSTVRHGAKMSNYKCLLYVLSACIYIYRQSSYIFSVVMMAMIEKKTVFGRIVRRACDIDDQGRKLQYSCINTQCFSLDIWGAVLFM